MGTVILGLLGQQSQNNSFVKHMLGLYLYATGAQHQLISILTNLGLCSSYVSIAGGMQSPLVDNGAPPAAPPPDKQVDESEDKDEK